MKYLKIFFVFLLAVGVIIAPGMYETAMAEHDDGLRDDVTETTFSDFNSRLFLRGQYDFTEADDLNDGSYKPLLLAQNSGTEGVQGEKAGEPLSPECSAFARDPDADLGDVIRAGCEPTLAQMSALMDNPLGNVAMLFTQFDYYSMEDPVTNRTAIKSNYMGIAQFPKKLTEDWSIINRIVWNVPSMPLDQDKINAFNAPSGDYGNSPGTINPPASAPPAGIDLFEGRTTGFGDIYYNGLFTPREGIKLEGGANFLWGLGFDLGIPTASDDILGTGKWLAGPSGLGVYMGPKWKVGALLQQYWDFAGDDDRSDVSMTNLQYFIFYSIDETTSIGAAPNIIANWEQDGRNIWTVPIGIGISKTIQMGKVPVRFGAEVHYSVITPDDTPGAEWDFRFYVIPAVPAALFSWMN
jgi:hypothetical protein